MTIKLPWLSLILLLVAQTARTESQIEVQKTEEPNSRETIYTATSGSCGIEWTLRRFSKNSGFGISERSKCKLPLVSQIPFRAALLLQVVADTNNMQAKQWAVIFSREKTPIIGKPAALNPGVVTAVA